MKFQAKKRIPPMAAEALQCACATRSHCNLRILENSLPRETYLHTRNDLHTYDAPVYGASKKTGHNWCSRRRVPVDRCKRSRSLDCSQPIPLSFVFVLSRNCRFSKKIFSKIQRNRDDEIEQ